MKRYKVEFWYAQEKRGEAYVEATGPILALLKSQEVLGSWNLDPTSEIRIITMNEVQKTARAPGEL